MKFATDTTVRRLRWVMVRMVPIPKGRRKEYCTIEETLAGVKGSHLLIDTGCLDKNATDMLRLNYWRNTWLR